jgi:hypothetical protein
MLAVACIWTYHVNVPSDEGTRQSNTLDICAVVAYLGFIGCDEFREGGDAAIARRDCNLTSNDANAGERLDEKTISKRRRQRLLR